MRYILLFLVALFFSQGYAQNYTTQDMTLQLDENGEATLIPEDVLVNTTGTLVIHRDAFDRRYHFDSQSQTLVLTNEGYEDCTDDKIYSYDRNPINKREYYSAVIVDGGDYFVGCEGDVSFGGEYGFQDCPFNLGAPNLFSFDKDGILYESGFGEGVSTLDFYSNISTPWLNLYLNWGDHKLTYDFDNHRLIYAEEGNVLRVHEIDIESVQQQELFEITLPNECYYPSGIEYIGNNLILVGVCTDIYLINLVTQETTFLANEVYFISNFYFIEDEIPDATMSQSQYTCNDVGEQTVEITVLENGNPVNYQAIVNVVPEFSVRNCAVFRRLTIPDPNGSDDAVVGDYTDTIDIVSSCSFSFTVTQDPPPGTLIPHEQRVDIILTVTDEFGNMTLCKTVGCSDSPLGIDDQALSNNIIVYPIPTTDQITIENRNNISLTNIEILDINGRHLGIKEINSEAKNISLSLSSYSSGVYFVKINAENDFLVKQIIKQ